jgi:hypothetical protein
VPAVIDNRLRHWTGSLIPLPAGLWSAQVPAIADPERRAYAAEIAAMMDARKDRIGEHAATNALPWAVNALGPVPSHPLDRPGLAAAGQLHRRLAGTIRPRPPRRPDRTRTRRGRPGHAGSLARGHGCPRSRRRPRHARHAGRDAAAPARHLTPSRPPGRRNGVGDELRQVRTGACQARLAAIRAAAEARAAQRRDQHEEASQQQELAPSYQALHDIYAERETVFDAVMADRADWDTATRAQRHLAVAADAELRRRHPSRQYPPLRSAEPPRLTQDQRHELTLTTGEQIRETGQWIKDLAAQRHALASKLANRQSLTIQSEDPDYGDLGQAFPPWPAPAAGAILRPPKPKSSHPNGSSNASPTAPPTGKPQTEGARCILKPAGDGDAGHRPEGSGLTGVSMMTRVQDHSLRQ